ncbi:MAG: geranylgeranyl reductase family protein, partial [Candidatus Marinimicrobia bacterium]|nr:geranylgeranyl reductase family protein [Candidatus Neomarinimicrobiota bacterium]
MSDLSQFDIIIVGAGPAGSTATLYAAKKGLRVLLLDKATFPRDKVCGDALSGKTVDVLKELDLMAGVRNLPGATINRIIFGSPDGSALNINLSESELNQIPEGFVIRRAIFDHFLFEQARAVATQCHENFTVTDIIIEDDQVRGVVGTPGDSGESVSYRAPITFGADGYRSIVARKLGLYRHDPKHVVVALRQYYQGVEGLTDQIELHFIDEVNPGYFWLFPLEDGKANIGIGMLHKSIKHQNIDLKQALANAISSPRFKERFSHATPLEDPVGWNLPVGSKHYPSVGNGFMLLGDAAGLIDPFTGEGIGNALYSAR